MGDPVDPPRVQTRNPKTGQYVLIDRERGAILEHRNEPYEGVPFAKKRRTVKKSKLQHTEIPLYAEETGSLAPPVRGFVIIKPAGDPYRSIIQLQINFDGLRLYDLSPEEAHLIGSSLVEHAGECGYDEETGETPSATPATGETK
jgi:hypothetical protein